MRILLIGASGSIGQRYKAVLNFLNHDAITLDITDRDGTRRQNEYYMLALDTYNRGEFDKGIICTPTDQHYSDCMSMIHLRKPFLCEKPVSKVPREIEHIIKECQKNNVDGRMCSNYKFTTKGLKPISFDYFKTGSDGLFWDCIQLLYMNPEIQLNNTSFIWQLVCDGETFTYRDWEYGFYDYVLRFLTDPESLWNMEDAYKATETVLRRIECQK